MPRRLALRLPVALLLFGLTVACAMLCAPVLRAQSLTSVYDAASLEARDVTYRDARLLTTRETDTRYVPPAYPTVEQWERRAQALRERILVSAGLWPMPDRTPPDARVARRHEGDGYVVENVVFESLPGFVVAGNVYRPSEGQGPFPAVLSPHGHWEFGRTTQNERSSVPARGIALARQGFVVFAYDMVGYGDTRQVGHSFAEDSLSQRWGISLLGLQLWNGLRALDLLASLPGVDTTRLAVTGASGGGTQAFLLTAVDPRIRASAPVNMISTVMQGGCLCENAPGLRLDATNVELGALAAPRPLLMVSNTQDWTVHTPQAEYPWIRRIYGLYGAEDRVRNVHLDFPHNYNRASREAVYAWLRRWLQDGAEGAAPAEDALDPADLLVYLNEPVADREQTFDEMPPALLRETPPVMDEPTLKALLRARAAEALQEAWPRSPEELARFRQVYGTAFAHVVAAELPEAVSVESRGSTPVADFTIHRLLLARAGRGDWIPAVLYEPAGGSTSSVLLLAPEGKRAFAAPDGTPAAPLRALLDAGHAVLTIDPFGRGEHVLQPGTATPRDEAFRHFLTFNRSDAQERVQDVLTAVAFLRQERKAGSVALAGVRDAAAWALLAAPIAGGAVDRVAALELELDLERMDAAAEPFVPGLARVGGLRTAAALAAPTPLLLHAARPAGSVAAVYELGGTSDFRYAAEGVTPEELAAWLGR